MKNQSKNCHHSVLFSHGITPARGLNAVSIEEQIRSFLHHCEKTTDLPVSDVLMQDFSIEQAIEKSRSTCSICQNLLSYYINSSAVGEHVLLYQIPEHIGSKEDFLSTIIATKCSSVFIPHFGYISFEDPKLYACYKEHEGQCYVVFQRLYANSAESALNLDSLFFSEQLLLKKTCFVNDHFELTELPVMALCSECSIDYSHMMNDHDVTLDSISRFITSYHMPVFRLFEVLGFKYVKEIYTQKLTKKELVLVFLVQKITSENDEGLVRYFYELVSTYPYYVKDKLISIVSSLPTKRIFVEKKKIDFNALTTESIAYVTKLQDLVEAHNISIIKLKPTSACMHGLKVYLECNLNTHVELVGGIGQESPATKIFSFLNLYPLISKLYTMHPLAKLRGFQQRDFSISQSDYICKDCKGSKSQNCHTCNDRIFSNIFDEITYVGLSIGDLLTQPISDLTFFFDRMIPQKALIIKNMKDWGMGSLTLSSNLAQLNLFDCAKMVILSKSFEKSKTKKTFVFSEMSCLVTSDADLAIMINLFSTILLSDHSIVIFDDETLDPEFSLHHS